MFYAMEAANICQVLLSVLALLVSSCLLDLLSLLLFAGIMLTAMQFAAHLANQARILSVPVQRSKA